LGWELLYKTNLTRFFFTFLGKGRTPDKTTHLSMFRIYNPSSIFYKTEFFIAYKEPMAHTCSPSYSGGRDQEDHSSKPARANSLQDPISKKHITEKGWWSGSSGRESA
jgi:hypothetical protein